MAEIFRDAAAALIAAEAERARTLLKLEGPDRAWRTGAITSKRYRGGSQVEAAPQRVAGGNLTTRGASMQEVVKM